MVCERCPQGVAQLVGLATTLQHANTISIRVQHVAGLDHLASTAAPTGMQQNALILIN
jgi:hypothetical protein